MSLVPGFSLIFCGGSARYSRRHSASHSRIVMAGSAVSLRARSSVEACLVDDPARGTALISWPHYEITPAAALPHLGSEGHTCHFLDRPSEKAPNAVRLPVKRGPKICDAGSFPAMQQRTCSNERAICFFVEESFRLRAMTELSLPALPFLPAMRCERVLNIFVSMVRAPRPLRPVPHNVGDRAIGRDIVWRSPSHFEPTRRLSTRCTDHFVWRGRTSNLGVKIQC
jgi:hypothetical protein